MSRTNSLAPSTTTSSQTTPVADDQQRYTLPLRALGAGDLGIGGGKAVNLGRMLQADLPVPDGFCVTTDAYVVVAESDALESVISRLASAPPDATAQLPGLGSLAGEARAALLAAEMPAAIAESICAD